MRLLQVKPLRVASCDKKAPGTIKTMDPQITKTHPRLISAEDRLLMILTIKGIFQRGMVTAAINPHFVQKLSILPDVSESNSIFSEKTFERPFGTPVALYSVGRSLTILG